MESRQRIMRSANAENRWENLIASLKVSRLTNHWLTGASAPTPKNHR